jgi:nucleoid DNA-binding protein
MVRSRNDIINIITENLGVNAYKAENCVVAILDNIMEWVANGDEIQLRGFGSLKPQHQAARKARVVKEDRFIEVPARIKPKFTPSKLFYDKCNNK